MLYLSLSHSFIQLTHFAPIWSPFSSFSHLRLMLKFKTEWGKACRLISHLGCWVYLVHRKVLRPTRQQMFWFHSFHSRQSSIPCAAQTTFTFIKFYSGNFLCLLLDITRKLKSLLKVTHYIFFSRLRDPIFHYTHRFSGTVSQFLWQKFQVLRYVQEYQAVWHLGKFLMEPELITNICTEDIYW